MNEKKFWLIVENSLKKSAGSFAAQEAELQNTLMELPVKSVATFAWMFASYKHNAYRYDLWAAAYLVGGGCSNDSFMDFRSWLISRGQRPYTSVLDNPDNLADIDPGEDYFFEGFQYVPRRVYKKRTEDEVPRWSRQPQKPGKSDWDFDFDDDAEMTRRLPRLSQKIRDNPAAFGF